jgi:acetyltransferase-like isoleucine patch superfamily enzyme
MSTTSNSMNVGFTVSHTLVKKRYILINILIIWLSLLPVMILILNRFHSRFSNATLNNPAFSLNDIFIFPLLFLGWWALFTFLIFFNTWIAVKIINLFCKPKEGVFNRLPDENGKYDRNFRYWSLRNTVKKTAAWASHFFPIPWIDFLAFKMFGVKFHLSTALMDSYVCTEFLEIGEDTLIGATCVINSSAIIGDKLIIKKIKIGNNCLTGGNCFIAPGTIIEDNVMLGARSSTRIGQVLESGWIYFGNPAIKVRQNDLATKMSFRKTIVTDEGREFINPEDEKTNQETDG